MRNILWKIFRRFFPSAILPAGNSESQPRILIFIDPELYLWYGFCFTNMTVFLDTWTWTDIVVLNYSRKGKP